MVKNKPYCRYCGEDGKDTNPKKQRLFRIRRIEYKWEYSSDGGGGKKGLVTFYVCRKHKKFTIRRTAQPYNQTLIVGVFTKTNQKAKCRACKNIIPPHTLKLQYRTEVAYQVGESKVYPNKPHEVYPKISICMMCYQEFIKQQYRDIAGAKKEYRKRLRRLKPEAIVEAQQQMKEYRLVMDI
jgi:hypothetical protein